MYTVKHVARMTGIPADTVRMWERRYGVVSPARSEGGYRMYDEASVRRLAAMQALVAAGWSPRRAAEQVKGGTGVPVLESDRQQPSEVRGGEGGNARPSLVPLARDLDAQLLESTLTRVFASEPFEELVDEWLMPALAELGGAWQEGLVSIGGEHFVSAGLQRHVADVLAAARPSAAAPRVVAGLARASRHELGILSFAATLGRAGADVLYVGADLPTQSWVETAAGASVRAVVLSAPTVEDVPGVRDTVAAVSAGAPNVDIYIGGSHQDAVGDLAHPLGHAVVPAVQRLVKDLNLI